MFREVKTANISPGAVVIELTKIFVKIRDIELGNLNNTGVKLLNECNEL